MSLSKELKQIEKEEKPKVVQKPTLVADGFLAEQIWDRKGLPIYYVKHFNDGSSELESELDLGEVDSKGKPIIYRPVDNLGLRKGLVILPTEPKETSFSELFNQIDEFATRCYDACGKEATVKLLTRVVVGSWFLDRFVQDKTYDIAGAGKFAPIIPIRGPSQAGKNRLAFVLRLLSYRPYFEMSTYRVPSIYRPLDLWNGSLVLDEADFTNTSEKSELIHFLNCRATGTPISRQDPKNPRQIDVFTNFGQTILTQRRVFDDNATESRCLPFYSEVTEKKLPTVETDEMLREGLELQNMLLFLRLEYYKHVIIDKAAWLSDVSDPRLVASLLPLLALSKIEPSIKETIKETVKDFEKLKVEQKANSEDGIIINSLWEKGLFAFYQGTRGNETYYFQTYKDVDEDQQDVVPLTVGQLADEFKLSTRNLRKILNSLNLCSAGLPRVIKVGSKTYRVVFFDPRRFEKRLREFVVDYIPYDLYDKLGLEKPKLVTEVTQVTLPDMPHHLESQTAKKEDTPCAVTSVTCVTDSTEEDK